MSDPRPDDDPVCRPTYTLDHLSDDQIDVMLHELQVVEELKQEDSHD